MGMSAPTPERQFQHRAARAGRTSGVALFVPFRGGRRGRNKINRGFGRGTKKPKRIARFQAGSDHEAVATQILKSGGLETKMNCGLNFLARWIVNANQPVLKARHKNYRAVRGIVAGPNRKWIFQSSERENTRA